MSYDDWPPVPQEFLEEGTLKGVITHLQPKYQSGSPVAAPYNADDPGVRWLLEAGVTLLKERFLNITEDRSTHAFAAHNQLMSFISSASLLKACAKIASAAGFDIGQASDGRRKSRWKIMADYQADLLAYVFRFEAAIPRLNHVVNDQLPNLLKLPFGELVEVLAISESETAKHHDLMSLQLALQLALPYDRRVHELAHEIYARHTAFWGSVYEFVFEAYGFSLPVSHTWSDMAHIFNALVEGTAVRALAGADLITLSNGRNISYEGVRLIVTSILEQPWEEVAARRAGQNLPKFKPNFGRRNNSYDLG